jgi:hypothetical protein
MKESEIQKAITDYLKAHGVKHWRNNMGAVMHSVKGEVRYRKNPNKGIPDLFCLYCGLLVGIEVKAKTKQTKEQLEWQKELEDNGAVYILARSVADVDAALKSLHLEEVS